MIAPHLLSLVPRSLRHLRTPQPLSHLQASAESSPVVPALCLPGLDFTVRDSRRPCARECLQLLGERHRRHTQRHCFSPSGINGRIGNWFTYRWTQNGRLPSCKGRWPFPSFLTLLLKMNISFSSRDGSLCSPCPRGSANHPSKFDCQYLLTIVIVVFTAFVTNCFASTIFFQTIDVSISF